MRWHLLGETERQAMGAFITVAVAYDMMTAVLVRDYLRESKIPAYTPTSVNPIPSLAQHFIWVPKPHLREAIELLQELRATWKG